jgi:hypothetical protein
MMYAIEMSRELAPLIIGVNVLLVVSAAAIVGAAVAPLVREWLQNRERPRIVVSRPRLVSQASH